MTVEQPGFWLLGNALIDKQEGLHYLRNFDNVKPLVRRKPVAVGTTPAERRAMRGGRGLPDVQAA